MVWASPSTFIVPRSLQEIARKRFAGPGIGSRGTLRSDFFLPSRPACFALMISTMHMPSFDLSVRVFACIFALSITAPTHAELAAYVQDFESMAVAGSGQDTGRPNDIAADGWTGFAANWQGQPSDRSQNGKAPLFTYGTFPAPNGGSGFCGIATQDSQVVTSSNEPESATQGLEKADQGNRHFNIYSDYNEPKAHGGSTQWLDAIVFRGMPVATGDAGKTWQFSFDYKANSADGGTLAPAGKSKTFAFIKVLKSSDQSYGTMASFEYETTTANKSEWKRHSIPIEIKNEFEGELLQFGFRSEAQDGQPSGMLYDNLRFQESSDENDPEVVSE